MQTWKYDNEGEKGKKKGHLFGYQIHNHNVFSSQHKGKIIITTKNITLCFPNNNNDRNELKYKNQYSKTNK